MLAALLRIWSKQTESNDQNISSMTGRMPSIDAPMPSPTNPASLIGVSTMRLGPNLSSSPSVTLYAPLNCPTSSPMTTTFGSRSISSARACRMASRYWMTGIAQLKKSLPPDLRSDGLSASQYTSFCMSETSGNGLASANSAEASASARASASILPTRASSKTLSATSMRSEHFFLYVGDVRERARLREFGGSLRLGAGLRVDPPDEGLVQDLVGDKHVLEDLDRVLGTTVLLDLGLVAVRLVGVGDGVAPVAVGAQLDEGRLALVPGQVEETVHERAHLVRVVPVADPPRHPIGPGAPPELAGGRAGLAGSHRVAVVLDHKHDGEVPKCSQVVRLVHGALVDRAVPHERHAGPLEPLVLERIRQAGAEGHLPADDPVAAPEIARRVEEMHRPPLPLGAAGGLPVELGHEGIHLHPDGDGVAVVAVGGDD